MFYVAFPTFFGKRVARDGQWGQITDVCKAEREWPSTETDTPAGRCPDCTMKGRGNQPPTLARDHLPRAKPFSPSFDTREYGYTFVNYLVLAKICGGGGEGGEVGFKKPSKRVHRPNKLAEPSFLVLRRGRSQYGVK